MKKYLALIIVVFLVIFSNAQKGLGFDLGIATSKAPMFDIKYFLNENAFSLGASYQIFNDALGKKKDGVIPGTNAIGDGDYFFSVDMGYTRLLNEKFSVSGEISIGNRKFYQNLSDNNFSEGGYHRITKTNVIVGVGASITYNANDIVGFFAGYNSIREAAAGVQIKFVH